MVPLVLTRLAQSLFAGDIARQADLGPGMVIVHGFGLVINSETVIEGICCLFHGVTPGDRGSEWVGSSRPDGHPLLEPNVRAGGGRENPRPDPHRAQQQHRGGCGGLTGCPPFSIMAGVLARVVGQRPVGDIHD